MEYRQKYLKYKSKYLELKKQMGGMMKYHPSNEVFRFSINPIVTSPSLALFNVNDYPVNYDPSGVPLINFGDKHVVTFQGSMIDPLSTSKIFGNFKFNYKPLPIDIEIEKNATPNFLRDIIGSLLGLNNNYTEIERVLTGKSKIIIVDFANIVGVLLKKIRPSTFTHTRIRTLANDDEKNIIRNIFEKFLLKAYYDPTLLYIIVAKPFSGVNINIIINEFAEKYKLRPNFFVEKCIILNPSYIDIKTNAEIIVREGGMDDFILWILTISLYNLAKYNNIKIELLTQDEQQIYKHPENDKKTILSGIFPNENINIIIRIIELEEDGMVPKKIVINTIFDLLNNYFNILLGLFKRETVSLISRQNGFIEETLPLYKLKSQQISNILYTCEKYYVNEIFNSIEMYNRSGVTQFLPICVPKLIDGQFYIMPNCLKLIYYIRLLQLNMYNGMEKGYTIDEILRILGYTTDEILRTLEDE
jgi:hypothetical protein